VSAPVNRNRDTDQSCGRSPLEKLKRKTDAPTQRPRRPCRRRIEIAKKNLPAAVAHDRPTNRNRKRPSHAARPSRQLAPCRCARSRGQTISRRIEPLLLRRGRTLHVERRMCRMCHREGQSSIRRDGFCRARRVEGEGPCTVRGEAHCRSSADEAPRAPWDGRARFARSRSSAIPLSHRRRRRCAKKLLGILLVHAMA
jgi:hypothetical protein